MARLTDSEQGAVQAASRPCWCGETRLSPFSDAYLRCSRCGTFVMARFPDAGHFRVERDAADFYGRTYWTEHVARAYGQPTIFERARLDLPERCVFWLDRVLERTAPPARVLELGCGSGAFVHLLREAGFDAIGLEMSPWVADFARRVFDVQVLRGPLEDLDLPEGSFGAVAAFDVLEHLEDPLQTMRLCRRLLGPRGVLFLQTPCYRGEGPAWEQFKQQEHTFLFDEESVRALLESAGFGETQVRGSLFTYDMWVTSGREALPPAAAGRLDGLPPLVRALADASLRGMRLDAELEDTREQANERLDAARRLQGRLDEVEGDRALQLRLIDELSARLQEVEVDRDRRLRAMERLTGELQEVEADRERRLRLIRELTTRLEETEGDRAARLALIEELTGRLEEVERDRAARLALIEELSARLEEVERDRAARLALIEELSARLEKVERDRARFLARSGW